VHIIRLLPYALLRRRNCLVLLLDRAGHAALPVQGLAFFYLCWVVAARRRACVKADIGSRAYHDLVVVGAHVADLDLPGVHLVD